MPTMYWEDRSLISVHFVTNFRLLLSQVKRDARIGEAEAKKDSGIKEAMANERRMQSEYYNQTQIALAKRDFELKKAEFDKEVETKKATSALAYDLQRAKTKQLIQEENMQVKTTDVNVDTGNTNRMCRMLDQHFCW